MMEFSRYLKRQTRNLSLALLEEGFLCREPCNVCGAVNSEMHHKNYHDPCDILWLCRSCHVLEHKNGGGLLAWGSPLRGNEPMGSHSVRFTDGEWELIGLAANNSGVTRTDFVRTAALDAARKALNGKAL